MHQRTRRIIVGAALAATMVTAGVGLQQAYAAPPTLYLPWSAGEGYAITQGGNGTYSHNDIWNFNAIDFGTPSNTQLRASAAGTVVDAGWNAGGGNMLLIKHPGADDFCTQYLHLNQFQVKKGDAVQRGQKVALSGNTGAKTTGPHLHWNVVQCSTGKAYYQPQTKLKVAEGVDLWAVGSRVTSKNIAGAATTTQPTPTAPKTTPSSTASPRPSSTASPTPSSTASPRPSSTARPSNTASPRPSRTAQPTASKTPTAVRTTPTLPAEPTPTAAPEPTPNEPAPSEPALVPVADNKGPGASAYQGTGLADTGAEAGLPALVGAVGTLAVGVALLSAPGRRGSRRR
ncbi:M23 family metallopeptidase [Granulicoccus phenolivorans]|uniref:M23 family metallopeptidase n=1 Tax=Granulicoccus phenolivorans TaxID=266854 RepID=UPI0003FF6C79|nr:M23 family metallopeptidase [Granulicoccus phenolivorans]